MIDMIVLHKKENPVKLGDLLNVHGTTDSWSLTFFKRMNLSFRVEHIHETEEKTAGKWETLVSVALIFDKEF